MKDTDFKFEVPFFTDEPLFALGVEAGMIYERLSSQQPFEQSVHSENRAQIEMFCVNAGAIYELTLPSDGWILLTVKGYAKN